MSYSIDGYVIVPPVRPWDQSNKDEIQFYLGRSTFAVTPGEAWTIHCRSAGLSPQENSERIQRWFDQGYRLRKARLTLLEEEEYPQ